MALNSDFKVKNSLYVSNSAFFGGTATSIDTTGAILSAGTDLFDIFSTPDIADLTSGACIASFSYDGQSVATVAICSDAYNKWDNTYTTVNSISGNAVCDISAPATQGGVTATDRAGVVDTITIHNLAIGDSPTFAGLCSTGGLSATDNIVVGGTVDGVDIAARDAVLTSTTSTANAALPKAGGNMTGAIAMGTCKITNLSNPTANQDAATKKYVDDSAAGTVCSVNGSDTITVTGTTDPIVSIAAACVTALSGAFCTATSSGTQGKIGLTRLNGGTCTLDIGLCTNDNVQFAAICATGNIAVDGTVDGRDIANDGTTSDTLRSLSGANIVSVTSPSQGTLNTTSASSATPVVIDTGLQVGDSPTFAGVTAGCITVGVSTDNTITTAAGNLTIDSAGGTTIVKDNHIVTGDSTIYGNLSVTGDFTCIETTVSVTSALSVTNTGTGPALFVCQTGVQPIAHFIDKEGGDIVFNNDGYVGIGTFSPSERLTVSGNISANGTLRIDGVTTIGGDTTIEGAATVCGATTLNSTVTLGGISTGTSNTVVVSDGGSLVTDDIDSKVWTGKVVDYNALDSNYIPKAINGAGTIGNSCITDDGTTITLNGNVTYGDGATIKQPSAGGTVHTLDNVYVGTVGTTATCVPTFAKSGLNSVKYEVTLQSGVNITTFEVHAVYNGTAPCGTVYAIVDAQAASQLVEVEITSSGATIDLDITAANASTEATIYGKAKY